MAFAQNFSLEATRPDASEIATLASILPPGTPVYLTAVPTVDPRSQIDAAAGLRKAGLEPVPHIAARRLAGGPQLKELLDGLRGEADVRRLLVIGGDVETSGPFTDALAVIQKGSLREAGIEEIGIGAYPEGHPRISQQRLEAALDQKIAAARAAGLLRYAKRCGVSASLRGLMAGTARGLIGHAGPDAILAALEAAGDLNASPHYFSFGGAVETARYACEAAAGRIAA